MPGLEVNKSSQNESFYWWSEWGSNPHALRHRILSPACIPVPPSDHSRPVRVKPRKYYHDYKKNSIPCFFIPFLNNYLPSKLLTPSFLYQKNQLTLIQLSSFSQIQPLRLAHAYPCYRQQLI